MPITIEYFLVVLSIAMLASTTGGVFATAVTIVFLVRRQDSESHRQQTAHETQVKRLRTDHEREVDELNAIHARTTSAMQTRINNLEAQASILVGMLQGRNLLSAGEVLAISANSSDPLFQIMCDRFTLDELEVLAAMAGLDIEDVRSGPRPNVALRLKQRAEDTGKRAVLVDAVRRMRPDVTLG